MIPYEVRKMIYERAIDIYGEESQILKAIEEMAELTNELAKTYDPSRTTTDRIVDEIADVTIMMEQLRLIFGVNEEVQDRIDYKVVRLCKRLEERRYDKTDNPDPATGGNSPSTR